MRWRIFLLLLLARIAAAEGGLRVESISFVAEVRSADADAFPRPDPLVFWTPGVSERVIARARLASPDVSASARVVLAVEWALLPAGAPLRDDSIVWSEAEELRGFEMALPADGRGDVFASIPIARRSLEWREAGLEAVRCRVTVRVGEDEARRSASVLEIVPAGR